MRLGSSVFAVIAVSLAAAAWGQSKNLAPGFTSLPKGAGVVIMPTDIELFSISGGGVLEPKADWTEAATQHFKTALRDKDRKSTRLNSSHGYISYAVFCLKKKKHIGRGSEVSRPSLRQQ